MDDNLETQKQSRPWRAILQSWLDYLIRIFLFALGVAALIGASFLFTGSFSSRTYSDRLFLSGVIITGLGVFVFVTVAGTRRNMGLPTIARSEEEARKLMEKTQELVEKAEKRYDAGSQIWAIGIACVILSILSYFLISVFGN